jgi:Na+/H+-dicarboxylate symporter/ABC-type amino acid transport substrate-binding protein
MKSSVSTCRVADRAELDDENKELPCFHKLVLLVAALGGDVPLSHGTCDVSWSIILRFVSFSITLEYPFVWCGAVKEVVEFVSESPEYEVTRRRKSVAFTRNVLIGFGLGVAVGLFFGPYCAWLELLGDAFVGLLQMTVLPYIAVSLVANLGRLNWGQAGRLILIFSIVTLALWGIHALVMLSVPLHLPEWEQGSFFSTTLVTTSEPFKFLELFIPSNIFRSLADNAVPAVVVFCIAAGIALIAMDEKSLLVENLELIARVLQRVNSAIVRATPVGVFAITAHAAGTYTLEEFQRLPTYLLLYTSLGGILAFWILPGLVTICTPFSYGDVMRVSRDAMVTAFATGKLIVVLPILIERTEELLAERGARGVNVTSPDVVYPLAYPFPNLGKMMGMIFIPFAAWFLGQPLVLKQYPAFIAAGTISYFGGPIVATPFLLDMARIPEDMFQLFLVSGIYCGRLGDMVGTVHLVALCLVTSVYLAGSLRIYPRKLFRYVAVTGLLFLLSTALVRTSTSRMIDRSKQRPNPLELMEAQVDPVRSVNATGPNPVPLKPGQSVLDRILERGVIRIGCNPDQLPFTFRNHRGSLMGFDVDMANHLARDLKVSIEWVPFSADDLVQKLRSDHFDIAMSGVQGNLQRAQEMLLSESYFDATLAVVVRDYDAKRFDTLLEMRTEMGMRIGVVGRSELEDWFEAEIPDIEFVRLERHGDFFEGGETKLDGLLISAEAGSAWTLLCPEYHVLLPAQPIAIPYVYPIANRDEDMENVLNHWIELRRKDGMIAALRDYWIYGRGDSDPAPRWCVLRDVLGWVD